jgi:hypothetical protein
MTMHDNIIINTNRVEMSACVLSRVIVATGTLYSWKLQISLKDIWLVFCVHVASEWLKILWLSNANVTESNSFNRLVIISSFLVHYYHLFLLNSAESQF